LAERRAVGSYRRKGNRWGNAPMESFFASPKKDPAHRVTFATRADAERAVFGHIEVVYNRVRRHSTLGYVAPATYEAGQP
jgi:putative transposase